MNAGDGSLVRRPVSWLYIEELPDLPGSWAVLATLCDLRVPLTFDPEDCAVIAEIIGEVLAGPRA